MLKSCFVSLWLGNWAQCRQMGFIHYDALASDEEAFICIEKGVCDALRDLIRLL